MREAASVLHVREEVVSMCSTSERSGLGCLALGKRPRTGITRGRQLDHKGMKGVEKK